jgi:hypothetical protein
LGVQRVHTWSVRFITQNVRMIVREQWVIRQPVSV